MLIVDCVLGQRRASLVAQMANKLPATQETWVQGLDREDPLGKGKAACSSILAWRIPVPQREESGGLQSTGSQRVGHDSVTNTHSAIVDDKVEKSESTNQLRQNNNLQPGSLSDFGPGPFHTERKYDDTGENSGGEGGGRWDQDGEHM